MITLLRLLRTLNKLGVIYSHDIDDNALRAMGFGMATMLSTRIYTHLDVSMAGSMLFLHEDGHIAVFEPNAELVIT